VRRLVLTGDLSLDGFVGRDGLDPGWARDYDDDELVRYRRRVVHKAGVHALEEAWTVDALAELKDEGGEHELAPIVAEGGAGFCQELTRRRLVDEYRITVHPVVFGEGHRLFSVSDRFHNIGARFFVNGSVAYTYVPVGAYRDHPPPLPWALPGTQGTGEHDHDPQADKAAERPAPS
jgi:RibD C-terminal domain